MFLKILAVQITLLLVLTSTQSQGITDENLLSEISTSRIKENVAISPTSINLALEVANFAAESLRNQLRLRHAGVNADDANSILGEIYKSANLTLKIINRIYVSKKFKITPEFQQFGSMYLSATGEEVNFDDKKNTANKINNWVKQQSQNKIKNIVSPDSFSAKTDVLIVNAIYLKAKWLKPFVKSSTTNKVFHLSKTKRIKVDMMHTSGTFEYAELPELDAKAIALPYAEDDIKLLVDGLGRLIKKLKDFKLGNILDNSHERKVSVCLPKFKIEFGLALRSTLEKLGQRDLFTPTANLNSADRYETPFTLSDIIHKVLVDVTEENTEAAAVAGGTDIKVASRSKGLDPHFNADHPFVYAILFANTVLIEGHVANPSLTVKGF